MRRFDLHRDEDVSGVSGTGIVAEGVAFGGDGPVALRWTSEWPTSVVFHDRGIESLEAVHGHNGRTRIVWLDPAAPTTPDIADERDERERQFCHTVQLPDEDQGECEWDQCPLLTEGCCALPMPPRATAITPEDLAAMDGLIVGSMCHCDDPDDCFDHWQFFIVDDPATAMYDGEHVGQGRTLNEAQMRHLAALATPSTPGDGQGDESASVRILRKLWEQTEIVHTATKLLVPKEWNEDEAPDRVALTPDEMAFWRALGDTPEPATGQGEPS